MRRPRRRKERPVQFPSYSSAAGDGLIQSLARRQPDCFYRDGAKSGRKAAWNTEQVANANHHRITNLLAAAALESGVEFVSATGREAAGGALREGAGATTAAAVVPR